MLCAVSATGFLGTTGAGFLLFGDVETSAISVTADSDPTLCSAPALVKIIEFTCGLFVLISSFVFLFSFPFNDATIATTEPEDILVNGFGGIGLVLAPLFTFVPARPAKTFFGFATSGVTGDIKPFGGDPLISSDLRGTGGAPRRVCAFCSPLVLTVFSAGEILVAAGVTTRGGKGGARRAPAETLRSEVGG